MAHDIRNERTEQAIVDAFLQALEEKPLSELTVSDIVRRSGIGRSTFYAHFRNIYDVFEQAVRSFLQQTRKLGSQLQCQSCHEQRPGTPFCEQLRDAGPYHALVREPMFLQTLLKMIDDMPRKPIYADLGITDMTPDISKAVFYFQMHGCYAVALNTAAEADWKSVQRKLDSFIRGGLAALRTNA